MKYLLVITLMLISAIGYAQQAKITLASDVWPPFTNVETEKSFATDLVKHALERTGVKPEFKILDFYDVISGINDGSFDGSAALWLSPEREKNYFFSEPYLQNQLILVGTKGSDVSAGSFDQLKDKKIGVVKNYAYGAEMNSADVEIVSGESDQQNLEHLLTGQIDYMLVDALLIQYMLKFQVNDVSEYLEIGSNPMLIKSLHFAIRKDIPGGQEIIERFNKAIGDMMADGTYNRILELNWIKTDVDGDGKLELVLDGNRAGTNAPSGVYGVYPAESLAVQSNEPERYYIKGKVYNGWDNVPDEFKKEIVMSAQDPKNTGIKLNFK
jgi:ABC-type amino acid transport substrate-binding protein